MKRCPDDLQITFAPGDPPAAELLAFAMQLREYDLSQERFWVRIPRRVFEALTEEDFKEVFSDLLLEYDPAIDQRMRLVVSSEEGFGLGRVQSGVKASGD